MNLIEAFESGNVEGVSSLPAKALETHISRLFFYENRVCKVYKYKHDLLIGNFGDFDFRRKFYAEDFSWNQHMSPRIYLRLHSVKFEKGAWKDCPEEEAEDYYIEMLKVDTESTLLNRLLTQNVSKQNLKDVASVMTERIAGLAKIKRDQFDGFYEKGWHHLMNERIGDLRKWVSAAPGMPLERCAEIMSKLSGFFDKSDYFRSLGKEDLSIAIDNHSGNVLLIDGKIEFIDIYLPKVEWIPVDRMLNICRIAADVAAHMGMEAAEVLYEEYEKKTPLCPPDIRRFYKIYNAFLNEAYYLYIGRPGISKKFAAFVDKELPHLG
ncbi:MAG: hypothetical protein JWO73_680 [Candidatus Taylorbacteria bacterium]|nr:hypothetical protein [Candidatus Taylorbacteria bacterium]